MINPINTWRLLEGYGIEPLRNSLVDPDNQNKRCALGWLFGEEDPTTGRNSAEVLEEHGLEKSKIRVCPLPHNPGDGLYPASVVHCNDWHKMSFGELADFIEANSSLFFTKEAIKEFGLEASKVS